MNKIALSIALTAALGFVGLKLAGSRIGELYTGTMPSVRLVKTSVLETAPRNTYLEDWRTVVAGEETGLAKPDADRVADPIGAFKRWAEDFMEGTAGVEEGLRLAKVRRP